MSRPQQQADSPTGFCSRRPDTGGLTSRHPPKATRLPRSGGSSKPLSEPPLAHDRFLPGWVVLTGAGSSWRLAWPAPSLSERLSLEGRRRRAMAGCRMLEREFPECRTPPLLAPSGPDRPRTTSPGGCQSRRTPKTRWRRPTSSGARSTRGSRFTLGGATSFVGANERGGTDPGLGSDP